MPVNWVDGVTPVNAANLETMEADIVAVSTAVGLKVDKDSVVVAGTRIFQNKLLVGDAQPVFRILGSGMHEWGGAGVIGDTNLFRNASNELKTNATLEAEKEVYARHGAAAYVGLGAVGPSSLPGLVIQGDIFVYRDGASRLSILPATDPTAFTGPTTHGQLNIRTQIGVGSNPGKYALLDFIDGVGRISVEATGAGSFMRFSTSSSYAAGANNTGLVINQSGGIGLGTGVAGMEATGHLGLTNSAQPSGSPTGGGVLFVSAGALKYRGSSGTVTQVAPA